jgi:hypothetical protein
MRRAVVLMALLMAGCAPQPYPYPDIVAALDSRERAIISQMYAGRLTQEEAKARIDEARMLAVGEETRRNAMNRPEPIRWPVFCSTSHDTTICN